MITAHGLTASQAKTYHEHNKEYYTQNMTNFDRWHGALAASLGLKGEVNKKVFDALCDEIENNTNRKNVGFDKTFSAPKSMSLALAVDIKTREDMIASHQEAIDFITNYIEMQLLETRSNGVRYKSRNCIAAEFMHFLARPTQENGFEPDLDLHSHVVFFNQTFFDGKYLAQTWTKALSKRIFKRLGVMYRAKLAEAVQKRGYEVELTNAKDGYFELKGFSREVIEQYSHREREVLEYAKKYGVDIETAKRKSRRAKKEAKDGLTKIMEATRKDLFASGKINIIRKEVDLHDQSHSKTRREINRGRNQELAGGQRNLIRGGAEPYAPDIGDIERRGIEAIKSIDGMPHLSERNLAAPAKRSSVFLSPPALDYLASEQDARIRRLFVQREAKTERNGRIDEVTQNVIKELEAQSFAFKLDTVIDRIMAAGVIYNISEAEARRALTRAGVVEAGARIKNEAKQQQRRKWNRTQDIYVTTKKNLETEKYIIDTFHQGKNSITKGVLTEEQSRRLLDEVEDELHAQGKTDFYISGKGGKKGIGGEQGEAIHALLTSKDDIVIWQGWAGTGKTTACERLKLMCDKAGIKVRGISFTNKAALGLQNESGITSSSIHSLLNKAEAGQTEAIDDNKNINQLTKTGKKLSMLAAVREIYNEALGIPEVKSKDKKLSLRGALRENLNEALGMPQENSKNKKTSVFRALGENLSDALGISKVKPAHNIPRRSMGGKIHRALREIFAEAFLDPQSAAKYRMSLEHEDNMLFKRQQEAGAPKKSDDARNSQPAKNSAKQSAESDKIKNEWDLSRVQKAKEPEIYVMDEAGLTDMHLFKQIQEYCHRRGAKLCLLGDTGQLIPVGAGMPMKLLQDEGATTRYLTDIRRQKNEKLLDIAKTLADKNKEVESVFQYYREKGLPRNERLATEKKKAELMKNPSLFAIDDLKKPLLVKSHSERREMNEAIRNILIERGKIEEGQAFTISDKFDIEHGGGERHFAAGDQIQFLENYKDGKSKAQAGEIATIEAIHDKTITVKTDGGETIAIDTEKFNSIDHGYVLKSQMYEIALPRERAEQAVSEATESTKLKDYKSTLLLVDTNDQRRDYNAAIREVFVKRGELEQGIEFDITDATDTKHQGKSKRHFAAGDRVIFTKKDSKKHIENNLLGTIESIDEKKREITIKTDMDDIGTVKIDMRNYNNIDHAYAFTEYKAQGVTIDKAIVVMDTKNSHNRNDIYVGVTRARYEAVVVTNSLDELEEQSKHFATKETGKDYQKLIVIQAGNIGDDNLYHYKDDQQEQMERALRQIEKHTLAPEREAQNREAEPINPNIEAEWREYQYDKTKDEAIRQAKDWKANPDKKPMGMKEWEKTVPPEIHKHLAKDEKKREYQNYLDTFNHQYIKQTSIEKEKAVKEIKKKEKNPALKAAIQAHREEYKAMDWKRAWVFLAEREEREKSQVLMR